MTTVNPYNWTIKIIWQEGPDRLRTKTFARGTGMSLAELKIEEAKKLHPTKEIEFTEIQRLTVQQAK